MSLTSTPYTLNTFKILLPFLNSLSNLENSVVEDWFPNPTFDPRSQGTQQSLGKRISNF